MSLFRLIFLYARNSCLIRTPFESPTHAFRVPCVSGFTLELF